VLRTDAPVLARFAPVPTTTAFEWSEGGTGVLTLPGGTGPHATVVLSLGADPAPPDDPEVHRLTDGLARAGISTLLVRSQALIDGRVSPEAVPVLVGAFEALRADPRVRPDRIAFVGLSVDGSLSLIAAADPRIASHVWFVLAFGSAYDVGEVAADV